jgi:hypothetical protein
MKIANKYIHPLLLNILTFKDGGTFRFGEFRTKEKNKNK